MLERRRGHVVIVSSGGGVRGFPEAAVYNGTKAAQRGFAEALRLELAAAAYRSPPSTRARSRPPCTTTSGTGCPPGITCDRRSPPGPLADQMVTAVEQDRRELFHPPLVRLLRVVNGISPGLADLMLRRILGPAAAPRRG